MIAAFAALLLAAGPPAPSPAAPDARALPPDDAELLRHLDLLEQLDLLDKLDLLVPEGSEPRKPAAPGAAPPASGGTPRPPPATAPGPPPPAPAPSPPPAPQPSGST